MDEELVKNAADPSQVRSAKKGRAIARDTELNEMRYVVAHKLGRSFLKRWLRECSMDQTTYTGNGWAAFKEGERNIGLKMKAELIEASPREYLKMEEESLDVVLKKSKPSKEIRK
jgi:hypothetical protein